MIRFALSITLFTLGTSFCMAQEAARQKSEIAAGKALIEKNCSHCHATGLKDKGPKKNIPPLRVVARRYNPESLQEAFAEGISVRHSDVEMPEFVFKPAQIDQLIAYLKTLSRP